MIEAAMNEETRYKLWQLMLVDSERSAAQILG